MSISAVMVVKNEENNIARALKSLKFVDEIIVFDMQSSDQTKIIAKKFTNQVFDTPQDFGYVEPARNLALSKAKNEWLLVLDADEEIPPSLAKKITELVKKPDIDVYFLPRKNIIFNKALEHSAWWPDYQARLFKKGMVSWQARVHRQPDIKGQVEYLLARPAWAITHYNYLNVEEFVNRSQKYTSLQAQERPDEGRITSQGLIEAFSAEFFRRFFFNKAYLDGMHGLALSYLQANYELLIKLKQWQAQGFTEEQLEKKELIKILKKQEKDFRHWLLDLEKSDASTWRKIYLSLKYKLGR